MFKLYTCAKQFTQNGQIINYDEFYCPITINGESVNLKFKFYDKTAQNLVKINIDITNIHVKEVVNKSTSEIVKRAFAVFDFNGSLMEFPLKASASDIFILSLAESLE